MIKKWFKHLFHPEQIFREGDLELRLQTAIAHIDTLETLSNKHMEVLTQLVDQMLASPDPSTKDLAEKIKPGVRGFQNSLVELKAFRPIFQTDKL